MFYCEISTIIHTGFLHYNDVHFFYKFLLIYIEMARTEIQQKSLQSPASNA